MTQSDIAALTATTAHDRFCKEVLKMVYNMTFPDDKYDCNVTITFRFPSCIAKNQKYIKADGGEGD